MSSQVYVSWYKLWTQTGWMAARGWRAARLAWLESVGRLDADGNILPRDFALEVE